MEDLSKQNTQPTGEESNIGPIPEKIGPYPIEALLEKGGMSILYLATHPKTKEPITIKVLFPEFVSNPEMKERFLREANIIALADHPNIVKLYGEGEWEGGLYIAMEFIQGTTLRQYMLRQMISLKHALEIVMEISMALCHLHSHGVIHRDLKPENILITENGGIKVIDFGIAQLLEEGSADANAERRLIGTPIYMSPEQKDNPSKASYPSDIYSLGIITYELVLGKLSLGQIHLSLMPSKLQKILTKALQAKPEDRYQDIVEFMTEISDYLNSPALLKESNPLIDVAESIRHSQNKLIPHKVPNWPQIDIGLAAYTSFGAISPYYDFLNLSGKSKGIILGVPVAKDSVGIIYSAILRGMVRSLCQLSQKPEELAAILNSLLINDPMELQFAFSYLILFPEKKMFRFISCQSGSLWLISKGSTHIQRVTSENRALGIDGKASFNEVEHPWLQGDTLIFITLSPQTLSHEQIEEFLPEIIQSFPQKQTDTLLRKIKVNLSRSQQEYSVVLISIQI